MRAKIIWKKPWINSYGHSLESSFSCSIVEQIIDLNYKIPLLYNPLEQYYLLQAGIIHEDTCKGSGSSIMTTMNIARYWNCSNSWQRAVNIHWYFNYIIQNQIDNVKTMLIYPGISISRIRQRGESMPYWGDSQRYAINISNICWKSNFNFIILQMQSIWIRTFLEKHRFLVRGNLSWMEPNNLSPIIPLLRFFSSGDRGIRGYKYKSLSYDSSKCFINVAKLITGAFEYQYNFIGKWWGAAFVDVGELGNNIAWKYFKFGVGIGIRWQFPVGPMILDVAIPLINKHKMNDKLYFYINLGPEL